MAATHTADAVRIGAALRAARKRAGLTQSELAEFIGGVDRHVIARLERGDTTTQLQRLLELLDVVGLELEVRPRTVRLATTSGAERSPHSAGTPHCRTDGTSRGES
jgi:transcriptional regulator with XRE-family HTH domain